MSKPAGIICDGCGVTCKPILESVIKKHKLETEHQNIAVNVTPHPIPEEVDVNITVNEQ